MFAQYVQGNTFGQVVKMAEAVTDFAKRCTDVDRDNPNCQKPLVSKLVLLMQYRFSEMT